MKKANAHRKADRCIDGARYPAILPNINSKKQHTKSDWRLYLICKNLQGIIEISHSP